MRKFKIVVSFYTDNGCLTFRKRLIKAPNWYAASAIAWKTFDRIGSVTCREVFKNNLKN